MPLVQEVGKCQVCGKEDMVLVRTYFRYNLNCECHSPQHFIVVAHCMDCVPKEPEYTTVSVRTDKLSKLQPESQNKIGLMVDYIGEHILLGDKVAFISYGAHIGCCACLKRGTVINIHSGYVDVISDDDNDMVDMSQIDRYRELESARKVFHVKPDVIIKIDKLGFSK